MLVVQKMNLVLVEFLYQAQEVHLTILVQVREALDLGANSRYRYLSVELQALLYLGLEGVAWTLRKYRFKDHLCPVVLRSPQT